MNAYEILVQCPDCGNTQPFNGTLKPRAHTRCSDCKKDFYVMSNLMPTDYNDNADKQLDLFETDNSTDREGNVYIGDADKMPTFTKIEPKLYITPMSFLAKVLKLLKNDLNTTLLEDKKKRLIRVLTAGDTKGNNYAWVRDAILIFIDYCIQKGLLKWEEEKG